MDPDRPLIDAVAEETRREFLIRFVGAAAASALLANTSFAISEPRKDTRATSTTKSRVVHVQDPRIIPERVVQRGFLRSYLQDGLVALGGVSSFDRALHAIFKQDDVILFKFNKSASAKLGTSDAMSTVLIDLFVRAGYSPEKFIILEGGNLGEYSGKTAKPDMRWQGKHVDFGRSGKDQFIAALDQATAIVNVPFLKTHHLATMTGCLKNLSHGLIRHPARFHGNGCDPAIGEIVSSNPIREKLKLNIVNGLRSVFNGAAEAQEGDISDGGDLLISRDPVAADSVGFSVLNKVRLGRGQKPLLTGNQLPRQLLTASSLGVGQFDESQITLESL